MAREFKLPELGEEVDEGQVVSILVSKGDDIEPDQDVIEIETEKATAEVPCPFGGKVIEIHVSEGDTIKVGAKLLTVEAEGSDDDEDDDDEDADVGTDDEQAPSDDKQRAETAESEEVDEAGPDAGDSVDDEVPESGEDAMPADEDADQTTTPDEEAPEKFEETPGPEGRGRRAPEASPAASIPAGPSTRRLARELGVELEEVADQSPDDRVTEDHVKAFVRQRLDDASGEGTPVSKGTAPAALPPLPDFSKWGPVDRVSQSSVEARGARHLAATWGNLPQVTQHDIADITRLLDLIERHRQRADASDPKLTITAFAVKAAVQALETYPRFNASLDPSSDELILKHYYHIGVAVDTDRGLLVPVIRDCDQKSVLRLAADLGDLADRARERKIKLDEMKGATFTISNVGSIGGTGFTPIVNYPEAAILGLTRAQRATVPSDDGFDVRTMLPICVSYDHRIINGADAARFTRQIAESLSDPDLLSLR
ncbi:MAG: 2-oxo acid dehydrogenase subunit E2 [Phycisphaerae bacterium]|jgi:pyruvate dehydrogenase E2 component (dihydrolipoamide acetyltransferase)